MQRREGETSGAYGERLAEQFLRNNNYKILARGHRQRRSEIDLVALEGVCVVFVEVKTRESEQWGTPAEAVDARKQRLLTRAALLYLKQHGLLEAEVRFDVIAILCPEDFPPEIQHFKHAFQATGQDSLFS